MSVTAPAFNPLIDGVGGYNPPAAPPASVAGSASANVGGFGVTTAADVQGTLPLTGLHNVPLRVGVIGVFALLTIIGLRLAGWKFSYAGALGKR